MNSTLSIRTLPLLTSLAIDSKNSFITIVNMKRGLNSYMYRYYPIDITSGNYTQFIPALINSSNRMHIVWYGQSPASPSPFQIRYVKSIDGGNTWSNPIDITSGSYDQYDPAIAIDSFNNIHIVWSGECSSSSNYYQIRYSKSTDGNTWSNPVNITSENYHQNCPKIAIDNSNNIHLVWQGINLTNPTGYQIRYVKSTDGGNTWSNPVNITSENYNQYDPAIAIDSFNNIHIVWDGGYSSNPNYQIRYSKSTDGGNTWSNPVNITSENYNQYSPVITINTPNNIHIVWYGWTSLSPDYAQIRYARM